MTSWIMATLMDYCLDYSWDYRIIYILDYCLLLYVTCHAKTRLMRF